MLPISLMCQTDLQQPLSEGKGLYNPMHGGSVKVIP